MSAERRAASRIAPANVVLRRTKAAHHVHARRRVAVLLEILQHQLELVDESQIEHQVLRPDVLLIVCEEIAESEVVRYRRVLIFLGDLNEPRRRGVARAPAPALRRTRADVREADPPTTAYGER